MGRPIISVADMAIDNGSGLEASVQSMTQQAEGLLRYAAGLLVQTMAAIMIGYWITGLHSDSIYAGVRVTVGVRDAVSRVGLIAPCNSEI